MSIKEFTVCGDCVTVITTDGKSISMSLNDSYIHISIGGLKENQTLVPAKTALNVVEILYAQLNGQVITNLAQKMTKLIDELRNTGFDGVKWPEIKAAEITKDYAICVNAYADDDYYAEGYNPDEYYYKFVDYLTKYFGTGVRVNFMRRSQQIEVIILEQT